MEEKGLNRTFLEEYAKKKGITDPKEIEEYVVQTVFRKLISI